MTIAATGASPLLVRRRTLEWWGAGLCLFLQTGAVLPLLSMGADGELGDPERARLRLVALPVYVVTILLLAPHARAFGEAVRRNLPFAILLALPLVSVLWSVGPSVSLRRALALLMSVLLAYVLAIRFSPRELARLVATVLGAAIVASLVAAVLAPGLGFMPGGSELRGVFTHKNVLGWHAMAAMVAGAALAADAASPWRKAGIALTGAAALSLLLSQSMTGTVAVAVAAMLAAFFHAMAQTRGAQRTFVALVAVQAAVAVLFLLDGFLVPLLEALGRDATLTGRVPLWALVDEQIARQPLTGYGFQAFWTDASPGAWEIWSRIGWSAPNAHSGIRDILLGLGIVGASVFAIVALEALRRGTALHCRAPRDGWLWLDVYVGVFIFVNLTESMYLTQNSFPFILFSAAVLSFSLARR